MWITSYSYLTSAEYKSLWSHLIEQVHAEPSPILYFYVTHRLFCELLKKRYPTSTGGDDLPSDCSQALTADEEGALRYVGGYMIRSVIKKLERRCQPIY